MRFSFFLSNNLKSPQRESFSPVKPIINTQYLISSTESKSSNYSFLLPPRNELSLEQWSSSPTVQHKEKVPVIVKWAEAQNSECARNALQAQHKAVHSVHWRHSGHSPLQQNTQQHEHRSHQPQRLLWFHRRPQTPKQWCHRRVPLLAHSWPHTGWGSTALALLLAAQILWNTSIQSMVFAIFWNFML